MFILKNLRKEKNDGWMYLKVDLDVVDSRNPFTQDTIWFAVEDKNSNMLTDDVYDAFLPFIFYLGMFYHQNIHIKGSVSPLLYHNLTHYVAKIFDNFSQHTQRIQLTVDGFKEAKKGKVDLIGTGISCGVDSLSTLYSNFVETDDKRLKVNSLFFFNCGQNGYFGEERTKDIWQKRIKLHQGVPKKLGLPAYYIDSNLHAFYSSEISIAHLGYISIACCVLSVQRCVKRYVYANNISYDENLKYGLIYKDKDLFEYAESYLVHLFSTERLTMVVDGCEFTRSEKLERLQDWDIAQKYLDVCWNPDAEGHNCSKCDKCIRTLLVLDAMGKLQNFKDVFDLSVYKKVRHALLCAHVVINDCHHNDVIEYLKDHHVFVPPKIYAYPRYILYRLHRKYNWIKEHGTWRDNSKWS